VLQLSVCVQNCGLLAEESSATFAALHAAAPQISKCGGRPAATLKAMKIQEGLKDKHWSCVVILQGLV